QASVTGRRNLRTAALIALLAAAGLAAGLLMAESGGSGGTVAPNSGVAIDPATNRIVADVPVGGQPPAIAAGRGGVWVATADDGTVQRIDPSTMRVVRTLATPPRASGLALGLGYVWASAPHGRTLYRIDPGQNHVSATIPLRCSSGTRGDSFEFCE